MARFGKGCARAMLLAALTMKHKHEGVAPTYAWLARKALETRPYWSRINETHFLYEKTGQIIEVGDEVSLSDVVQLVVEAEVESIASSLPRWRRDELCVIAWGGATDYLRQK
jgi:hypothetical protein